MIRRDGVEVKGDWLYEVRQEKENHHPYQESTEHPPSICVKRALASSAALAASLGRMKTLGEESMAAMDRISLEHLQVDGK